MVRLKVNVIDYFSDLEELFQFHYGTIKSVI